MPYCMIREERHFIQNELRMLEGRHLHLHHCCNPLGVSIEATESHSITKK